MAYESTRNRSESTNPSSVEIVVKSGARTLAIGVRIAGMESGRNVCFVRA